MPVSLDIVEGLIDATVMDDNFKELEELLKEGIAKEDFNEKFGKYKIRRYTGGRIVSFNFGSNPYSSSRDSLSLGTFENNWRSGTNEIGDYEKKGTLDSWNSNGKFHYETFTSGEYSDPNSHPFELLGFPGSSLHYDFQEQGIPRLSEVYSDDGGTLDNYPPKDEALNRFPKDECWSRWLTIPDAAGAVYVDEPCVALITATVKGNYFFTPAMRVHGINASSNGEKENYPYTIGTDTDRRIYTWQLKDRSGLDVIQEGQDQSAMLRLGLFVDTNPVVWDDEFTNGDDYGKPTTFGHSYNPWIGNDANGNLRPTKPDGVSKTRSWIKVREITYRVRQRNTYQITAAIELKGRRKYNFSLKFRPAGYYGYVAANQKGGQRFVEGYQELEDNASLLSSFYQQPTVPSGPDTLGVPLGNPAWAWGDNNMYRTWPRAWLWPGVDSLVTNFVEASSLGVEFFYGQKMADDSDNGQVKLIPDEEA
tara:strand:- start:493 stop:1926 length:1434 start_codon:yes stop_codon:yes gene_type:complete